MRFYEEEGKSDKTLYLDTSFFFLNRFLTQKEGQSLEPSVFNDSKVIKNADENAETVGRVRVQRFSIIHVFYLFYIPFVFQHYIFSIFS